MGLIPFDRRCVGPLLPLPSAPVQEHPLPAAPAQPQLSRAILLQLRSPPLFQQPQPPPPPQPLFPLPLLSSKAVLLLPPWALPLWPLPRGGITLGLAPLHHLHHIRGQLGGPRHPRGPGLQAQGSRPPRDLGRHPHRLIRASLGPRTYPLHPLSGELTSITALFRGMSTTVREICTGRFTTISRHLPRTRSSETPCPSCRDTTWSRS